MFDRKPTLWEPPTESMNPPNKAGVRDKDSISAALKSVADDQDCSRRYSREVAMALAAKKDNGGIFSQNAIVVETEIALETLQICHDEGSNERLDTTNTQRQKIFDLV